MKSDSKTNYILNKVGPIGKMERWKMIDECRFFLLIEGMLTQRESDDVLERLKKKLNKNGLKVTPL